jgi:hypothetical protein
MLSQTDLPKLIKILKEEYPLVKNKKQKSRILDDYCLNSGNSRKYIIRTIRSSVDPAAKKHRNRKSAYDEEVTAALIKIWELLDYPCGQRLKPILEMELDRLVQSGKLIISDGARGKLKKISSATIDRKLKQQKGDFFVKRAKSSLNPHSGAPQPVALITNVAPNLVTC